MINDDEKIRLLFYNSPDGNPVKPVVVQDYHG